MSIVMIQTTPTEGPAARLPAWMRRAGIDEETGTVFVCPGLANRGEQEAFLCAAFDGVSCVIRDGHVYLPAEWLASEAKDPESADACWFVEAKVRDYSRQVVAAET